MSTALFTCLACQVGFSTADEQRIHYRTDWHRYNLKRRIAEAAPVGEEEFRGRVDGELLKRFLGFVYLDSVSSLFCNISSTTADAGRGWQSHLFA